MASEFALVCSGRVIARDRTPRGLISTAELMSRDDKRHKYLVIQSRGNERLVVWRPKRPH